VKLTMEKFIIGLFSEQLETYIHGFRKEQLNANLLNGKGEISDVQIRVKPINDILKRYTNLIELSSVYVSKLSFNVTSFRYIKKAPIEISIDEVHIVLQEPLDYSGPGETAWPELAKAIVEKAKRHGGYGLIERIQDNITLDINRVYLTFQPMGKFKTRKVGKWTPPAISVVLNNLRFVSVDEYGEEGTPESVWRHNSRSGRQEATSRQQDMGDRNDRAFQHRTLIIYKKLTLEASVAIGIRMEGMTAKQTFLSSHLLIANLPLQSHFCIHKRISDSAILAAQIDCSLMNLEVEIDADVLPLLIHALVGVQSCVERDQSFVDPLKDQETKNTESSAHADVQYDPDEELEPSKDTPIPNDESDSDELSADENDEVGLESITSGGNSRDSWMKVKDADVWPVLVLPAGLIIVEKICMTVSFHHIGVRVRYHADVDDYLQVTMKGFVSEFIYPKTVNSVSKYCIVPTNLASGSITKRSHLSPSKGSWRVYSNVSCLH